MNELTEKFDERRRALREEDQTSVSLLGTIRILLDEVERLRTHVDELQRRPATVYYGSSCPCSGEGLA